MTDFEDRLTTALRSAGDDAPDAAGLAPAARRRAGARRRRTALTSLAAVVAVAGVAGGAALLGDRDGANTVTAASDGPTPTATSSPVAPGSRVESWRDLSVTVPAEWGHGYLDDWCGSGGDLGRPVVQRPEGASIDILCDPQNGYGVQFMEGSAMDLVYEPGHVWQYEKGDVAMYPAGSWLGYQRGSGDNLVWVVAADRRTVEEVLATFEHGPGADPHGCTARPADPGPTVQPGTLLLCRYGIDDWLEQSELLTGQDAADAVAALEAAPAKGDRMCTMALTGPVVMLYSGGTQGRLTLDACQGFVWGAAEHDLTADVLYWALSPGWSGGVEGEVPMPDALRQ